ncbi:MAG: ferrous iron transport protein B [Paludibacteraceae bacterium]
MRLSELKTGEKASIVKVYGHGGFRKRIIEMGFVKGKIVQSILNAPLNDPIKYSVMGYEVSLRRSEAELIEVLSEKEALKEVVEKEPLPPLIEEEVVRKIALKKRKRITIALVGNPNCGKTTLFNIASGQHEHVGNYSGVTVGAKIGVFHQDGYDFQIVDLPGTYSLSPYSPEEKYVRNYLLGEMPDVVINVLDSSNIERNLFLTTQLIDMHLQTVVALNMYDELQKSGDKLDYKSLGKLLGAPFVPVIAKTGFGVIQLFRSVIKLYESSHIISEEGILINSVKEDKLLDDYHHEIKIHHRHGEKKSISDLEGEDKVHQTARHIHINHGTEIEHSIKRLKDKLMSENFHLQSKFSIRFLSIKLLENDTEFNTLVSNEKNSASIFEIRDEEIKRLSAELKMDVEAAITDAKYGFIAGALKETYIENKKKENNTLTDKIDSLVTHRFWGYPIFLFIIFVMFESTFVLGNYPMNWIEQAVGLLSGLLRNTMAPGPLKDLLIDGIIGGVGGVIVFLPNILILYFFISFMEDTGYMARAAFIMDKIMHKMGLHGKSFIPMIMGFGCNVPAIMSTRTIENRGSRMITILINPLMSCSARLPVYLLLAGIFFQHYAGVVLFAVYITGILLAVIIARLLKRFVFSKDETPFVMELPPYRIPSAKSMWKHTWLRGQQYLRKMGTIILIGSIIIWFLGYYPRPEHTNVTTEHENTEQLENSYIGHIGRTVQPILAPLGFDWKISIALLSGVAAKEIVVSTLGVLYSGNSDEDTQSLSERMRKDTTVDNVAVYTPGTALAFMLFVLIYFPCLATIVAIKNETGSWRWSLFAMSYSLLLAWGVAWMAQLIF